MDREKRIYRVTLLGGLVNLVLLVFKFAAGILGHSAAMMADAIHSLSDFVTDIVVLVCVRLSSKPADSRHDYGHGKYETFACFVIGLALLWAGAALGWNGICQIRVFVGGGELESPGVIALVAAVLSIVLKEGMFRITRRVAREVSSPATEANAWHHRSDALSSIGTALGIGGAVILGKRWAVLDPIAAVVVCVFIIIAAFKLIVSSTRELLEESLPDEVENRISELVYQEPGVSDLHHLRTRKLGANIAIEMHLRMPGDLPLEQVHSHASSIENRLRAEFGESTHIMLHLEPVKKNQNFKA